MQRVVWALNCGSAVALHRRGIGKEEIRAALAELLAEDFRAAALPALTSSAPADERLRAALEATCRVDEQYLGLIEGLGDDASARELYEAAQTPKVD